MEAARDRSIAEVFQQRLGKALRRIERHAVALGAEYQDISQREMDEFIKNVTDPEDVKKYLNHLENADDEATVDDLISERSVTPGTDADLEVVISSDESEEDNEDDEDFDDLVVNDLGSSSEEDEDNDNMDDEDNNDEDKN